MLNNSKDHLLNIILKIAEEMQWLIMKEDLTLKVQQNQKNHNLPTINPH